MWYPNDDDPAEEDGDLDAPWWMFPWAIPIGVMIISLLLLAMGAWR